MFVARLVFSETALMKLARRGIALGEVEQLPRNGAIGMRNPRPRVPGSRMLIGPTDGGRLLTVVIEPDHADDGTWFVRTGWEANLRERNTYRRSG